MPDERLSITVKFPINEPTRYEILSDIHREMVIDVIAEFVRAQIGAGRNLSPPERHAVYEIHLQLDLSSDKFYCSHNCGNDALRDGILLDVLRMEHKAGKENTDVSV